MYKRNGVPLVAKKFYEKYAIIREDEKTVIMMRELIMTANDHYWKTQELRELGRKLVDLLNKG